MRPEPVAAVIASVLVAGWLLLFATVAVARVRRQLRRRRRSAAALGVLAQIQRRVTRASGAPTP
ncbi:MAG: hypothetical protein ABR511_08520 [Acidimicrobiales bacterium]